MQIGDERKDWLLPFSYPLFKSDGSDTFGSDVTSIKVGLFGLGLGLLLLLLLFMFKYEFKRKNV